MHASLLVLALSIIHISALPKINYNPVYGDPTNVALVSPAEAEKAKQLESAKSTLPDNDNNDNPLSANLELDNLSKSPSGIADKDQGPDPDSGRGNRFSDSPNRGIEEAVIKITCKNAPPGAKENPLISISKEYFFPIIRSVFGANASGITDRMVRVIQNDECSDDGDDSNNVDPEPTLAVEIGEKVKANDDARNFLQPAIDEVFKDEIASGATVSREEVGRRFLDHVADFYDIPAFSRTDGSKDEKEGILDAKNSNELPTSSDGYNGGIDKNSNQPESTVDIGERVTAMQMEGADPIMQINDSDIQNLLLTNDIKNEKKGKLDSKNSDGSPTPPYGYNEGIDKNSNQQESTLDIGERMSAMQMEGADPIMQTGDVQNRLPTDDTEEEKDGILDAKNSAGPATSPDGHNGGIDKNSNQQDSTLDIGERMTAMQMEGADPIMQSGDVQNRLPTNAIRDGSKQLTLNNDQTKEESPINLTPNRSSNASSQPSKMLDSPLTDAEVQIEIAYHPLNFATIPNLGVLTNTTDPGKISFVEADFVNGLAATFPKIAKFSQMRTLLKTKANPLPTHAYYGRFAAWPTMETDLVDFGRLWVDHNQYLDPERMVERAGFAMNDTATATPAIVHAAQKRLKLDGVSPSDAQNELLRKAWILYHDRRISAAVGELVTSDAVALFTIAGSLEEKMWLSEYVLAVQRAGFKVKELLFDPKDIQSWVKSQPNKTDKVLGDVGGGVPPPKPIVEGPLTEEMIESYIDAIGLNLSVPQTDRAQDSPPSNTALQGPAKPVITQSPMEPGNLGELEKST
jgi:hypothetical protein